MNSKFKLIGTVIIGACVAFSLLVLLVQMPVKADVEVIFPSVTLSSYQLEKGQAFTATYTLGNMNGVVTTTFKTTVTVNYDATDGGLTPVISSGNLHMEANQRKMRYTWTGEIGPRQVATMTLSSRAGQNTGVFENALVYEIPGGDVISKTMTVVENLPNILQVSRAIPTQNFVITGTNLIDEEGGEHYIFMRIPLLPFESIKVDREKTLIWTNEHIEFILPQTARKDAIYRIYIWRNTVSSNELSMSVDSGWESKVDAPQAAAGNDLITYTFSITNTSEIKRIAASQIYIAPSAFITESVSITPTAGEIRLFPQKDGRLMAIWGADLLPQESVKLTISGKLADVPESTFYNRVLEWVLPDGNSAYADLTVVPDDSVQMEIQQTYLPLVFR